MASMVLAGLVAVVPYDRTAAAGASVLVLAADSSPTQFIAQLSGDPGIASVTYRDASTSTPSAQDLAAYNAVVIFDNFPFQDSVGLGDAIATYLDGGGTVVAFEYDWCGGAFALGGRWLTGGYSPFDVAGNCVVGQADHFTSYTGSSPIMTGVGGLDAYGQQDLNPAQGATLIASWDDSIPLVATKGRAVGVNAYVGPRLSWSGPFDLLVANALAESSGTGGTPPVITPHVQGTLGRNDWYTSDVVVSWSVSDPSAATSGCSSTTISVDTPGVTLTCSATAGGSSVSSSVTVKRDATAPVLHVSGAPDGTAFNSCSSPPGEPSYAPSDNLSGLDGTQGDSWSTPSGSSGLGTYVYSAHATDNAGNTSSETRTYTRVYGDAASGGAFGGFVAPLASDGSRRVKLGSTLPIKFLLQCGTQPISDASARLVLKPSDGTPTPGTDTPSSGGSFSYVGGGQYQFNLSTKSGFLTSSGVPQSFAPGSWTLSILLGDGTYRSVEINLVG